MCNEGCRERRARAAPEREKGLPEDRQQSGKKRNTLKEEVDAMLAQMQAPGSREAMMRAFHA